MARFPWLPERARVFRMAGILAVLAIWGWLLVALSSREAYISSYRTLDDRTIALQVAGGVATWCRVTEKTETDREVRVRASCLTLPIFVFIDAGAVGDRVYLPVVLDEPLGTRTLRDGNDGRSIPIALPTPPGFSFLALVQMIPTHVVTRRWDELLHWL